MVALLPDSPLYREIFDGVTLPSTFVSNFPTYAVIKNAFLDPANRVPFLDESGLNGKQLVDVQLGMRMVMRELVRFRDDIITGLPANLLTGLRTLVQTAECELAVKTLDVLNKVMKASGPKDALGAVLGVGLAALGVTVPVVGTVAAAVVAIATAIVSTINAQKARLDEQKAEDRARLYRAFPPLLDGGKEVDELTMNERILRLAPGGDWSDLYAPRYKGEWFGMERAQGYEFACGEIAKRSDIFGGDQGEEIIASGGVGCKPGTNEITGIVRVSLSHDAGDVTSDPFWSFMRGGPDPRAQDGNGVRGKTRVMDTGRWLVSSAKMLGCMWDFAMQRGNPLKYRIDTLRLSAEWKAYCENGLRYVREVCYPWYPKHHLGGMTAAEMKGYKINPDANLEGYFGTAVFAAIGAFGCSRTGLVSVKPKYQVHPAPFGITGDKLGDTGVYGQSGSGVWSALSGGFLPIMDPAHWPDQCMGTIYDRGPAPIKTTLENLRKTQRWELWHTLAAAFVHEGDAAFAGDPQLLDELRKARAALLKSDDRFYVSLSDISDREPGLPGQSASWLKQCQDAGITSAIKHMPKGLKRGAIGDGGPKTEPPAIKFVGLPASPLPPPDVEPSKGTGDAAVWVVGGAAALALGLTMALGRRGRR